MDETGQEVRPSSGDSESGSEGFVQVTQEDARLDSERTEEHQLEEETRIPAVDDDMDLYGGPEDVEGEEEEQEGEQAHKEEEMEEEAEPDVAGAEACRVGCLLPPSAPPPLKEPLLDLQTDMPPQEPLLDLGPDVPPPEPLLDLGPAPSQEPLLDLGPTPPQEPLLDLGPTPPQEPLLDFGPFEVLPPEPHPMEAAPPFTGETATGPQDVTPPEPKESMHFEPQETTPLVEATAPPPVLSSEPEETTPQGIQKPSEPGVEEVAPATSSPAPPAKPPKAGIPKPSGYLSFLNMLHPVVLYIIYWCDVKLSAVVLGVCLVVLLTLTLNTVLHTVVLLLLSFMVVSLTYIITKVVIDSFYNKKVHNPFNGYLSSKVALPEKEILEWTRYAIGRLDVYLDLLVRLLLFDNIKYSLMFGCFLWLASFVTNCCSFLSLLFLLVCVSFSVPVLYAHFQSPIDGFLNSAVAKIGALLKKASQYIPLGKKAKAE